MPSGSLATSSPTTASSSVLRLVVYFGIKWGGLALGLFLLYYALGSLSFISPGPRDTTYPIPLDKIRTGDLILCAGFAPSSRTIRTFSHSNWTHVGMAVRVRDAVYIAHSDINSELRNFLWSEDEDDPERRENGVQINKLTDFLGVYPGDVYVRQMAGGSEHRPKVEDVWRITAAYKNHTFRNFLPSLLRCIGGRNGCLPKAPVVPVLGCSRESFFCSQFLAQLLVELKILDGDTCVELYHPCSFAPEYDQDRTLGMEFANNSGDEQHQRNPFKSFVRIIAENQPARQQESQAQPST